MHIKIESYEVINELKNHLNCSRPEAIEIALAKGIASNQSMAYSNTSSAMKKWEVPVNIIKDDKYILYRQLIIEELKKDDLSEEELKQYFIQYIEHGAKVIQMEFNRMNGLSDYRIEILNQES